MAKQLLMTPVGIASYPWLDKPDTKFKDGGEFKTNQRHPRDEVADLLAKIDAAQEDALKVAHEKHAELMDSLSPAKAKKLKPVSANDVPYEDVLDDDGEETGEVDIKLRKNATYKDRKTGEIKKLTVTLRDCHGTPIKGVNPWGGSKLRCAFEIRSYYIPANGMAGVRLNLEQVQIIELVEGSNGANPFEDEEGGFTAPDEDKTPPADQTDDTSDEAEEDDDF